MNPFVKMPSSWIMYPSPPTEGLKAFSWLGKHRSHNIAALMLYVSLLHNVKDVATASLPAGATKLAYSELQEITGLSRTLISAGIKKLEERGIVTTDRDQKTSIYHLVDSNFSNSWGKLPYKSLYTDGKRIGFFHELNLRKKVELDALKLYLLIAAFRDNRTNHMSMAYDKIVDYTGIIRTHIKSAVSFLVVHNLIQVDQTSNDASGGDLRRVNHYRIVGIGSHHFGNMNKEKLKTGDDVPF